MLRQRLHHLSHQWAARLAEYFAVAGGEHRGTMVALGDSITDGYGATPNADNRYPDEFAERLLAAHRPTPVVNAGISGKLNDSPASGRRRSPEQCDVANQPVVRTVCDALAADEDGARQIRRRHLLDCGG